MAWKEAETDFSRRNASRLGYRVKRGLWSWSGDKGHNGFGACDKDGDWKR